MLLTGTLGNAVGALEEVLGDLDVGGTVDEALRGSLEGKPKQREVAALPGGQSSSAAGEPPSGSTPQEDD